MPLHSLLVSTGKQRSLLLSKYLTALTAEGTATWERTLLLWTQAPLKDAAEDELRAVVIEEVFVVFVKTNDVVLYLSGTEECDELILTEVLETIVEVLRALFDKTGINEAQVIANYDQVVVCLSHILNNNGNVEQLNREMILSMLKMKPDPKALAKPPAASARATGAATQLPALRAAAPPPAKR